MNFGYRKSNYNTSDSYPRFLGDRFTCGTRVFFYCRIIKLVLNTNMVVRRGKFSNEAWSEASYYALRSVEGCGCKMHVRNMHLIEKCEGAVVFIGNHMSMLETFVLPGIICPRKSISFVVKKSLVDYPVFGLVMKATKPIVVDRIHPIRDFKTVMNDGVKLLKSGRSVVVFPQSTRSANFKSSEFNSIGVKLAKKANVPVVPLALKTDFWGNGKKIKDFGPLNRSEEAYIEFGEPMHVEGNGKREHSKIVNFIESKLAEWNHREYANTAFTKSVI
jgi:1-acyl-sn-glycerol-3-phosphate acyltransferase